MRKSQVLNPPRRCCLHARKRFLFPTARSPRPKRKVRPAARQQVRPASVQSPRPPKCKISDRPGANSVTADVQSLPGTGFADAVQTLNLPSTKPISNGESRALRSDYVAMNSRGRRHTRGSAHQRRHRRPDTRSPAHAKVCTAPSLSRWMDSAIKMAASAAPILGSIGCARRPAHT